MTDYPFDMQLVVDPTNPENVVADAPITIYDSNDTGGTSPLTLTSPIGLPIGNPLISNHNGFLQPFVADTPQVMWKSGGYTGYFVSFTGMRDEAVAARLAAEDAAAAAADAAENAQAPTDDQVDEAVARADIPGQISTAASSALASKLDVATAVTTYGDFQTALAKWAPKARASNLQTDKLAEWFTALGTGKAQALAIGDSITEGTGGTSMNKRWQTVLQALLREAKGSIIGAEFPYIAANPVTSVSGKPVVLAGTISRTNTFGGISGRTSIMSSGATETFTFYGDQFKLLYFMGSTTAFANVVVDGGAPVIFDTNTVRLGVIGNAAGTYTSPVLALGTHTVVVSRDASTPTGTNALYLGGMVTYNQDQNTGIRVLDGGYHGANSGTAIDWNHTGKNVIAAGGADLVMIAFGMNDVPTNGVGGTPVATFKTNTQSIISRLRAEGLTKSYLLVGMYQGNSKYTSDWTPYMTALSEIAAADPKVAFLNLGNHMPAAPNPYNLAGGLGLFADGLHPSDNGHTWIAQTVGSALGSTDSTNSRPTTPFIFGALGDGVTDDTAAVQAWLSSPNKNKVLPSGNFLISAGLSCAVAGATISGAGALITNTNDLDMLKLTADNIVVNGIEINGNGHARYLIWATGASPVIRNNYLHDAYSTTSSPRAVNIENNPGGGIVENNRINNVTAVGNATPGDANGAARAIAINGIATPNAPYYVHGNVISNILGEEGDAIQILFYTGTGVGYPIEANVEISNNIISNVSRRFIKIQASKCRIIGNVLLHNGTVPATPSNSIDIIQSHDVGIYDNKIEANPLQIAISIQGVSGALLQRCICSRNVIKQDDAKAWAGIYGNYIQQAVIADNVIWGGTNSVTIGNSDNSLIAGNKQYGGANASVSFNANSTNTNITTAYNISMNLARTNVVNSGTGARLI